MKCQLILDALESYAPVRYAMDWDNVGLLVGDAERDVTKVMAALDPSADVIRQAAEQGAELLVTHHPMLFHPVKRVIASDPTGAKIIALIRNGISYYAMHTNCDTVQMAEHAAELIGLDPDGILEPVVPAGTVPDAHAEPQGIGRVGNLERPVTLREYAEKVKSDLGLKEVRMIGDGSRLIRRAAFSTGSGKSMIPAAVRAGADVLIAGDFDHHTAMDALDAGFALIDGGHFGTEHFMVDDTIAYLTARFPQLPVLKAEEDGPWTEL